MSYHLGGDSWICYGKACIKGTRVMVSVVLDSLAAGESPRAVSAAYEIDEADVRAVLGYAAELTRGRVAGFAEVRGEE